MSIFFCNDTVEEIFKIGKIAVPSILTNSIDISMWVTDVIMLGHLGKGNLAAASIGTSYFNISWFFIEGVLTAQDTLSARAFGMSDLRGVRSWLYVSAAVSIVLCILGTILMSLGYLTIAYVYQVNGHISSKAALHVLLLIPNLWFLTGFRILQKYMLAQNIMMPAVYCSIIGNLTNVLFNYILMFWTGVGFAGVGISTSIARAVMLICLFYYIYKSDGYERIREEIMEIIVTGREELSTAFPLNPGSIVSTIVKKRKGYSVMEMANNDNILNSDEISDNSDHPPERNDDNKNNKFRDNKNNKNKNKSETKKSEFEGDFELSTVYPKNDGSFSPKNRGERSDIEVENDNSNNTNDLVNPMHGSRGASMRHPNSNKINKNKNKSIHYFDDSAFLSMKDSSHDIYGNNSAARILLFRSVRFVLLGLPGGFLLGFDSWIFDIMVVVTARMGSVVLGAQQILVTLTLFVYLSFPFALGTAVSVRIGQLLGAKKAKTACLSAKLTILAGFVIMCLCGTSVYFLSPTVGYLFTSDPDIQYRVTQLAPVLACFQVTYSVCGCAQGVLRGLGRQGELAGILFLAVWLVGLPTGLSLVYIARPTYGLEGLWVGLTSGMALLAIVLLGMIFTVDWDREVRKTLLKSNRLYSGDFVPFGLPVSGSRGVGGLDFISSRLEEELEDLDNIDITVDAGDEETEETL